MKNQDAFDLANVIKNEKFKNELASNFDNWCEENEKNKLRVETIHEWWLEDCKPEILKIIAEVM